MAWVISGSAPGCGEATVTGPAGILTDEGLDAAADGGAADGGGAPVDTLGTDTSGGDSGIAPVDAGIAGIAAPAGASVIAATGGASHFAVAAGAVWWTRSDGQKVLRAAASGGQVQQIATEVGLNKTGDITGRGGAVFWSSLGPSLYFIRKFAVDTQTKGTVLSAKPEFAPQVIDRMAADDTHVYFTTGSNPGPNYTGLVRRVKVGEGVVENLRDWQKEPTDLLLDGPHVYWTTRKGYAVQRMNKDGSEPIVVVKDITGAVALTLDETFVYFCNEAGLSSDVADGTVMRAARDGGTPVIVADKQAGPVAIAMGPTWVWWVNQGTQKAGWADGTLMRFDRSGKKKPELVSAGLARPVALQIDAGALFWLNAGSQQADHTKNIPSAIFKRPL